MNPIALTRRAWGRLANNPTFAIGRAKIYRLFLGGRSAAGQPGYQVWGTTWPRGRHSNVIQAVQQITAGAPPQNILSFGCSTGEETAELAEAFPNARVMGVDIMRHRVRIAQKRYPNPRIRFLVSDDPGLQAAVPFDLIMAKSVFVRHPEATGFDDISHLMRFEDFDNSMVHLAGLLSAGGHLVIYNANYRVVDTSAMKHLTPVLVDGLHQPKEVPIFGRDGRRLPGVVVWEVIFRKSS